MVPGERIARLGVNIDHFATLRQLRGTPYPDLGEVAKMACEAGAEQITVHLREDRRHIQDADVKLLRKHLRGPFALNLEIAAREEMIRIAVGVKPDWSCLVPERRQEVTTEGGLDLKKGAASVGRAVARLKKAGIRVSLFVEPSRDAVRRSAELGADAVELHTGRYCLATQSRARGATARAQKELERIAEAGLEAVRLGLHVHAGHGFDAENVRAVALMARPGGEILVEEFNIGHFLVCRAAVVGLARAVREMKAALGAP
jgi:pyridoxine 5-phosphate synthase